MSNGDKPAYPVDYTNADSPRGVSEGLTQREYFAGIAMQGMLSNSHYAEQEDVIRGKADFAFKIDNVIAKRAVELADALLSALENK